MNKSITGVVPSAIVVIAIIILAALGAYYVAATLPGSLPSQIGQTGYTGSSTLTGNFTQSSATYSALRIKPLTYVVVYIQDGASVGRAAAFNPINLTVVIGVNNTVIWKNEDGATQSVFSRSANFNSSSLAPTSSTGAGGTFPFTFPNPGVYNYWSYLYMGENGTVTVVA